MSRRIVTISPALMRAGNTDWDIDWRGQSAGQGNDGVSQVVFNRFPRWVGTPSLVLFDELVNAWRAVRWKAQGRAGIFRVPMNDLDHLPVLEHGIPFSTGELFSTGEGFDFGPFVTCASAAAAGAEEIVVDEGEFPVAVGQFLSHDDWPMGVTYRIAEGSRARIGVQMPLRRPIPAGARISLRACGLFEATDDLMGNPSYELVKVSRPQLSFVEWLNRP